MIIDDIKNRINIIELAKSEGLQLKKQSNRVYKTVCCFHNEKKASLTFYTDTNTFKCYGCGEWGDAINFYAKRHNLDYKTKQGRKETIKQLAGQLGLSTSLKGLKRADRDDLTALTRGGLTSLKDHLKGIQRHLKGIQRQPDDIYQALKEFCGELSNETETYLTSQSRGLTAETIKQFGIFSIKDYKKTKEFLLNKFSLERLQDLVLIARGQNRFLFTKHPIIIPVIEDGKIVAIRGRFFFKGFSDPDIFVKTFTYGKYQSTAGVADRLFNSDILKTLKKGERVYLCEGEFDTMIMQQHNFKAVGVLGVSNYNDETIKKLNDFDLVIAFDSDERGRKEALKISNIFYKQTGREVIREKLPDGIKDITELLVKRQQNNENI